MRCEVPSLFENSLGIPSALLFQLRCATSFQLRFFMHQDILAIFMFYHLSSHVLQWPS